MTSLPLQSRTDGSYYADKLGSLRDIFGAKTIELRPGSLIVDAAEYPIVDDVIVLLPPELRPASMGAGEPTPPTTRADFAPDIQFTFGEEWKTFSTIGAEHEAIFRQYFDLVDVDSLKDARVCDLGCGMGRWSSFVAPRCREIVLVDFSDAIFVARRNLRGATNAIFIMGDIRALPFRDDFADLVFSLGVLHHLPVPALDEVRRLRRYAPRLLVYLYYALDNKPAHFRAALKTVDAARRGLSRVKSARFRAGFTWFGALAIYRPLVGLGHVLRPVRLSRHVPLYEGYAGKPLRLIRQDVYDRFFTRIEQRVSRAEILGLRDTFREVKVSDAFPYWHFLAVR